MICVSSCLWQVFPWVFLLGDNFSDLRFDFIFFYDDIFRIVYFVYHSLFQSYKGWGGGSTDPLVIKLTLL